MRGRFNKVLSGAGHGSHNGKVRTSAGETVDGTRQDLALAPCGEEDRGGFLNELSFESI